MITKVYLVCDRVQMELYDWLSCRHRKLVSCMASAAVVFLLSLLLLLPTGFGEPTPGVQRGQVELRRIRSLATNSKYGECWARALEEVDTHCVDMTSESQGLLALKFTHCHLSSSGRNFPECPEGSVVSKCTVSMDNVAFNTYTEFFTHAHTICHFLQSEAWQNRAENIMHRLTESSAGVVEQLESTKQMAEELIEAQSVALQAQQEILDSGEELRVTLKDSTQGLRSMFSELSSVSKEQQVALSELFSRVSFLQNFLMMEAHSVTSCLYNAAALFASFLLTSTQRSSRARFSLMALVGLNFYLERKIYQFVTNSAHPEHKHMEMVSFYVTVLRRFLMAIAVFLLIWVCAHYTDPSQQSLLVLKQLQETQCRLQEALQQAGLGPIKTKDPQLQVKIRQQEILKKNGEEEKTNKVSPSTDSSDLAHLPVIGWSSDILHRSTLVTTVTDMSVQPIITHDASASRARRSGRHSSYSSSSSPLVYSILVEDKQIDQVHPRYSLRSRKSLNF
ncbi:uncharacterized protein LOC130931136 isoform X2 [Corythoichthys intestinalis]|uniref:uncharacterized protein LOC130931136 isoform X2 n=1 Tax=Corythoichthys intestinalis TaxID=161448 RepID=UPI0025A541F3|nr:uncharacterized protein LOC130931136 isoform X2 [Corythoichthys intestinalis]